jgi:hypothetical protein
MFPEQDDEIIRAVSMLPLQQSNDERQQALKWLKEYPNDPRAEAVRKKLGI